MEQRHQVVLALVQDGWRVVEAARRLGGSRQSVHTWIARYERGGLASLADRSHRPQSCRHQTSSELEAWICELRRQHTGWRPRRIEYHLARSGMSENHGSLNTPIAAPTSLASISALIAEFDAPRSVRRPSPQTPVPRIDP